MRHSSFDKLRSGFPIVPEVRAPSPLTPLVNLERMLPVQGGEGGGIPALPALVLSCIQSNRLGKGQKRELHTNFLSVKGSYEHIILISFKSKNNDVNINKDTKRCKEKSQKLIQLERS